MNEEIEFLDPKLFLVEYETAKDSETSVWFWATSKDVKMSPTFKTRDLAMDWLEKEYCGH